MAPTDTLVDGPYFEDLKPGQRFDDSPGLTLTEVLAWRFAALLA